jgi:hypothetical protein
MSFSSLNYVPEPSKRPQRIQQVGGAINSALQGASTIASGVQEQKRIKLNDQQNNTLRSGITRSLDVMRPEIREQLGVAGSADVPMPEPGEGEKYQERLETWFMPIQTKLKNVTGFDDDNLAEALKAAAYPELASGLSEKAQEAKQRLFRDTLRQSASTIMQPERDRTTPPTPDYQGAPLAPPADRTEQGPLLETGKFTQAPPKSVADFQTRMLEEGKGYTPDQYKDDAVVLGKMARLSQQESADRQQKKSSFFASQAGKTLQDVRLAARQSGLFSDDEIKNITEDDFSPAITNKENEQFSIERSKLPRGGSGGSNREDVGVANSLLNMAKVYSENAINTRRSADGVYDPNDKKAIHDRADEFDQKAAEAMDSYKKEMSKRGGVFPVEPSQTAKDTASSLVFKSQQPGTYDPVKYDSPQKRVAAAIIDYAKQSGLSDEQANSLYGDVLDGIGKGEEPAEFIQLILDMLSTAKK